MSSDVGAAQVVSEPADGLILSSELMSTNRFAGNLTAPQPASDFKHTWLRKRYEENPHAAVGARLKRVVDFAIAGSALLALIPTLALVALAILITLGRPVLYSQRRLGLGGRPFRCFKFRTMVLDGDEVLSHHLTNDPQAAREWQETQKLRNDPRVTALGRMLRRASIDELPQLFNVLRGEMSCVGPRPIVMGEIQRYAHCAAFYMAARPGLTGLWQVSGRNRLRYRDRVALDRFYVRRWSLWLDVKILLRTIPAVLRVDETS